MNLHKVKIAKHFGKRYSFIDKLYQQPSFVANQEFHTMKLRGNINVSDKGNGKRRLYRQP